jgi:hypothetical protein
MPIRELTDGDDLRLNEVFADATTPAGHMARSLFRPSSDAPLIRSVIAEVVSRRSRRSRRDRRISASPLPGVGPRRGGRGGAGTWSGA